MATLTHFAGKIYPDKSFSLGRVPRKKKRLEDAQYDRLYDSQLDWYSVRYTENGRTVFRRGQVSIADRLTKPTLNLQESVIITKKRGRYGKHGITALGKRSVKNIAILMQKKYGRQQCGFGTTTLPNLGKMGCKFILFHWGEIVRRFFQKLDRKMRKKNGRFNYVSCTEIQEKRFNRTKVPFPHLHFIYRCKPTNASPYYFTPDVFQNAWMQSIAEVFKLYKAERLLTATYWDSAIQVKTVRKSCAAYIGKYMSKGIKVTQSMMEEGYKHFPGQWWNASMQWRKAFKESIIHLDSATCSSFFYDLPHYLHEKTIVWARYVEAMICNEYIAIGLVGTLSSAAYQLLKKVE